MKIHKNIKNKIGKKYGRLIVIGMTNKRTNSREVIWKCQCDCNNQIEVSSGNLTSGAIRSCGCLQKESIAKIGADRAGANIKNIIGNRYGRLIVLKDTGKRKNRAVIWECKCDCGKIVEVYSNSLLQGNTKSCGCLQKEKATENILTFLEISEHSGNWKGGITPLIEQLRHSFKYRQWRSDIFTRDNFTCQDCGDNKGGNLEAHHKKSFSSILQKYEITTLEEALNCEELWNINNGITLCEDCHKKIHRKILEKKVDNYASSTL